MSWTLLHIAVSNVASVIYMKHQENFIVMIQDQMFRLENQNDFLSFFGCV